MLFKGNIEFKKAIIVNKTLLENIENIIIEYYDHVSYYVVLENKDTIQFKSLDELIEYDNYNKRKIKTLKLSSSYKFNLEFENDPSVLHNYNHTVYGDYQTTNIDNSTLIVNKIQDALNKNKQSWLYTFISKISAMYLCIALGIVSLFLNILNVISNTISATDQIDINMVFITVIIFLFIWSLLGKLVTYYFKPIIFYWGQEIERINKIENSKSNIFWVIIVGTILTIVLSNVI